MSETDFLKLKKHDNPETNTEKFDIENYLNGNWDKIDKNVGEVNTNISNINSKNKEQDTNIKQLQGNTETSSNKIAELEKELKEAQEDFYQNSIRGQASGEYIHVEDSSNCRARIGISGNHEQATREGYNLLDLTSLIGKTETKNGVTYKINEDCSITVNGTPTDYTSFNLLDMSLKAGTYKFVDGLNNNNVFLQTLGDFQYTSQNNTFSLAEDGKATVYLVILVGAPTLNNATLYPMIYEGTEDKPYEQYGAMPSPDYRSKVVAVGSNVNLLENTLKSQIINGIDVKVQDNGKIVLNGTATDNFALAVGTINKIKNMTFSGMCDGYGYNKMIAQVQGLNYNVNVVNSNQIILSDLDTVATVRLYIYKGTSIINAIIELKIVEGTEVGEYSKHGQGCVKVTKCNKNLAIKNVKGYFSISDFKIKIDNNSESFLFYAEKGKEYTRSCKVNLDRNRIGKIDTLDVTQGMTVLNGQEINSKKFICDDSGIYIWFVNSTLNDSIKESFQIEESSTESSFEQHEEKSYIMPIQQEMLVNDYLDYDNEEEVHMWKKLILTGNEVFTKGYDKERVSGFYTSIDELKNIDKKRNDTLSDFLCNCLIEKKFYTNNISDEVWGNVNTFAFSTANQHILALNIENISTVDELKAYLKTQYDAGIPVTIYYKQETPTRLAFTDEQKVVAKELNNARTYKNVTNITTDSKAILSLDYAKDLETLLTSKESEV